MWGLVEGSSHSTLCGDTPLSRAEVGQWVEYRTSRLRPDMTRKELVNVLKVTVQCCDVCVCVCVCVSVCVCVCLGDVCVCDAPLWY